jgi:hypothetical protein
VWLRSFASSNIALRCRPWSRAVERLSVGHHLHFPNSLISICWTPPAVYELRQGCPLESWNRTTGPEVGKASKRSCGGRVAVKP